MPLTTSRSTALQDNGSSGNSDVSLPAKRGSQVAPKARMCGHVLLAWTMRDAL
jgi:hypothetical protein